MICDLEDRNGSGPAGQPCLARRGNPRLVIGDGVFVREEQTPSSGWCGIVVFWAGAPKNAVLGDGTLCIWHVAHGGMDFWAQNEGNEGDSRQANSRSRWPGLQTLGGTPAGHRAAQGQGPVLTLKGRRWAV